MKKSLFVLSLFVISSVFVNAQIYHGDDQVFFDYEQPDARSEAMGKTQVTLYGNPLSSHYNPASSSFSEGLNVEYTHMSPQFVFDQSSGDKYNTYGISYNSKKYGSVSFDVRYFTYGKLINYLTMQPFTPGEYNYTLNYSYMLVNYLSIGININYFRYNDYDATTEGWYFDLGLLKQFKLDAKNSAQNLFIGASLSNVGNNQASHDASNYILNSNGTYINNTFTEKTPIPSTLKIGASYDYETKLQLSGFKIFKIMASAEYNDMLNSGLYTYDKLGAEFTFLETLKLRLGYYKEKINENSDSGNKENLSKFTYGFGVNVPVQKIINSKIPISLQFDYASLKAPSYSNIHSTDKHYSVFNLNLNVGI